MVPVRKHERESERTYVSKLASLLMEDMLRMLMEAHGVAHGPEGGMADLGRALGMLGTDEDCRDLDDNPERLQPDLIPGVVVRVRRDVTSPSFGWGAVTHDQIGVLRSRNQQDECKVAFESVGQGRWNCRAKDPQLYVGVDGHRECQLVRRGARRQCFVTSRALSGMRLD